ncbi:MAG TPA: hypothetical protein VK511_09525, partial [Gemmatimonadaceae bacterium]|nr:hypothetical protein [Gemmatimonadaceae bacterium]
LRFSNERVRWIGDLVERWHALGEPIREALSGENWTDATVRRWVAEIGRTRVDAFFTVLDARFRAGDAKTWGSVVEDGIQGLWDRAALVALQDPVETGDLAVNGGDLMKVGFQSGPQLGAALRALLEWVLDDPARNTHDQLLARAREMVGVPPHD